VRRQGYRRRHPRLVAPGSEFPASLRSRPQPSARCSQATRFRYSPCWSGDMGVGYSRRILSSVGSKLVWASPGDAHKQIPRTISARFMNPALLGYRAYSFESPRTASPTAGPCGGSCARRTRREPSVADAASRILRGVDVGSGGGELPVGDVRPMLEVAADSTARLLHFPDSREGVRDFPAAPAGVRARSVTLVNG